MFTDFFNNIAHFVSHQQTLGPQGQQVQGDAKAPPASRRAIDALPMVKVTADDVLEATNKECLICLEEQKIGSWSCKLQCGHLFHKPCVGEWLQKHCTCPVCRFEIETDDPNYERERKQRMKMRKLRLRKDEIQKKSIGQLRELCQSLNVSIAECIDKREIVDKLVRSGLIEVTEGLPPVEMTEAEFHSRTVAELRFLLLSFGLSDRDALEKSELRSRLLESGRVVINPDSYEMEVSTAAAAPCGSNDTCYNKAGISVETSSSSTSSNSSSSIINGGNRYSMSGLREKSVSQLRELCSTHRISTTGCLDKSDLVQCLAASDAIEIVELSNPGVFGENGLASQVETNSIGAACATRSATDGPADHVPDDYVMVQGSGPDRTCSSKSSHSSHRVETVAAGKLDHNQCGPAVIVEDVDREDSCCCRSLSPHDDTDVPTEKGRSDGDAGGADEQPPSHKKVCLSAKGTPAYDNGSIFYQENDGGLSVKRQQQEEDQQKQQQPRNQGATNTNSADSRKSGSCGNCDTAHGPSSGSSTPAHHASAHASVHNSHHYIAHAGAHASAHSSGACTSTHGDTCAAGGTTTGTYAASSYWTHNTNWQDSSTGCSSRGRSCNSGSDSSSSSATGMDSQQPSPNEIIANPAERRAEAAPPPQHAVPPEDTRLVLSTTLLYELSIREVKSIMESYGVSFAGCLEKGDMVQRLRSCESIRIIEE